MTATLLLGMIAIAGPVLPAGPALAVRHEGRWISWWSADRAPTRWSSADPRVTRAIAWRAGRTGVTIGELSLAGGSLGWRVRVILARIDPSEVELQLQYTADPLGRPDRWDVESAPADALLALNAGQFDTRGPWGWLIRDGIELQPPGRGPLAPAVVQDRRGRIRFVDATAIDSVRAAGGLRFAIQSYPALLLEDGVVPGPLREAGRGVNLNHRDARAALCELRDGSWLAMLTRFEGLGGVLEPVPIGLTTPEMAALAGALGCVRAMLLDGGMSGQLQVMEASGTVTRWSGLRRVPAGLVALPRDRTREPG